MFCVKCGVELANTEKVCPLCGTKVVFPEGERSVPASPLYPPEAKSQVWRPKGLLFVLTGLFVLAVLICLICDLQVNRGVDWSGYAIGGILLTYLVSVFPFWFRHPNPVIFLPCDIAGAGLLSLYICLATGGKWFLPFAFPVCGGMMLITGAAAALLKYLRKGKLFIWGGVCIASGGFLLLTEFLLRITFHVSGVLWSIYPLTALSLVGLMLIVIGICRPLRESLAKKLFL